jgi:hypothetical protein
MAELSICWCAEGVFGAKAIVEAPSNDSLIPSDSNSMVWARCNSVNFGTLIIESMRA